MLNIDEDALICDLAETYGIYDYEQIAPFKVAIFACGLRDNSRIKMKLSNQTVTSEMLINAAILDNLSFIAWSKTKDAQKGKNAPDSLVARLQGKHKDDKNEFVTFENPEDFFEMRDKIIRGQ